MKTRVAFNEVNARAVLGGQSRYVVRGLNLYSDQVFYCGQRKNECRCSRCDGRCGPTNGCPCNACFALTKNIHSAYKAVRCPSGHSMAIADNESGWICDDMKCRASYHTKRYRCTQGCDFDYCSDCYLLRGEDATDNCDGVRSVLQYDWFQAKANVHYCGRNVGAAAYYEACGQCDGQCGPDGGCQCRACYLLDNPVPVYVPPPRACTIPLPATPIPDSDRCYRQPYHNGDIYEGQLVPSSEAGLLVRNGPGTYTFSPRNGGLIFEGIWEHNKLVKYNSYQYVWYRCTNNTYASYLFVDDAMYVRAGSAISKSDSFDYDCVSRHVTASVSSRDGRLWKYDFFFSEDFKFIESGSGWEAPAPAEWRYGGGGDGLDYKAEKIEPGIFARK